MEASPSETTTSIPLLRRAMDRLGERDFASCQKLAAEALDSDPGLAAGILTVTGVLLAGDHYGVLKLSRAEAEDSQLVWTRFERLAATLARPELNDVAFVQEAYDLAYEAWSVLSDSQRKSCYDAEAVAAKTAPFWTLCPYCFWMFQYGKVYEECCLRCQNCSRALHASAFSETTQEIIVPGKDQYFLCYGVFPLGYKPQPKPNLDADGNTNAEDSVKRRRVAKLPARRMRNVKAMATKKKAMNVTMSDWEESESDKEKEKETNNGDGDVVFYHGERERASSVAPHKATVLIRTRQVNTFDSIRSREAEKRLFG